MVVGVRVVVGFEVDFEGDVVMVSVVDMVSLSLGLMFSAPVVTS